MNLTCHWTRTCSKELAASRQLLHAGQFGVRTNMHRLEHLIDDKWVAHSFPPVFSDGERVVAGVPSGDPSVFQSMVECLEPPYYLLYVLHTPRGEAQSGRYQSPLLSLEQVKEFLFEFKLLLCGDSRFDLWAHSPGENATVVWDRHNQLFGYGPVEKLSSKLLSLGFSHGNLEVPVPHMHHYRAELDDLAKGVLAAFDWTHTPLRPEDEQ